MVGKELTGFEELGRTLQELGCGSRELLVLRFLKTEVPFEEAVEKIGRLANGEQVSNSETATPQSEEKTNEDVEMTDSPAPEASSSSSPPKETATPDVISQSAATPVSPPQQEQESTSSQAVSPVPLQAAEAAPTASSKISVYQPSSSAQLAAATMQVPDEAYDLGIEDIKRMRAKYQELAQPQRLPSDKEIEEKNAAIREEMEKVALVRLPSLAPHCIVNNSY